VPYSLVLECEMGALQFGIRAKVSTLSLDVLVEWSLDRECEGKLGLEGQFQTLVWLQIVKELLDKFLSSRGIAGL
jgi:hypothetical protein